MRRLVALALVQALVLSTASASSLHVHEYAGHDHPEHRHGPASHEHFHSEIADYYTSADDGRHPWVQAESCEPGQHAVAVTMGCAQVPQVQVDVAELPGPATLTLASPGRSAASVGDVRVHGPPFDPEIPARAPPLTHLA